MKPLAWMLALCACLALPARSQSTWYVDVGAACPGSGTQQSPFCDIQYAIDQPTTLTGDTILLMPGTYFGRVLIQGKSLAIRSTNGAAATVIKNQVPVGLNSSSTLVVRGAGTVVEIEGLTVECGLGTPSDPTGLNGRGGGIYCKDASLAVQDCEFVWAPLHPSLYAKYGGGIYVENCAFTLSGLEFTALRSGAGGGVASIGSTGTIEQCAFQNNGAGASAFGSGGGVYCDTLGVVIRDCEFTQNSQEVCGGAIYGPATIEDCQLSHNGAGGEGGAVYMADSVTNCLITANGAGGAGGGLSRTKAVGCVIQGNHCYDYGPGGGGAYKSTLVDCELRDNSAGYDGGGALQCDLVRCTVEGNNAYWHGGGLRMSTASHTLVYGNIAAMGGGAVSACSSLDHCTIFDNETFGYGGTAPVADSNLTNCIVWGNAPTNVGGSSTASYSDVQGGWTGTGNIQADPLFWNPANEGFQLRYGSPCIDAGDPAFPLDPDGSRTDMGALWADPAFCGDPFTYCTAKINSKGCTPSISSLGECHAGQDGFFVTASNVINNKIGLMLWESTPAALPFAGGTLCVASPTRTPAQNSLGNPPPSDCSGTYSFHFSAGHMAQYALPTGIALFAQYWYRDPEHPDGTGVGLSNALQFMVCP